MEQSRVERLRTDDTVTFWVYVLKGTEPVTLGTAQKTWVLSASLRYRKSVVFFPRNKMTVLAGEELNINFKLLDGVCPAF